MDVRVETNQMITQNLKLKEAGHCRFSEPKIKDCHTATYVQKEYSHWESLVPIRTTQSPKTALKPGNLIWSLPWHSLGNRKKLKYVTLITLC